MQIADIKRMHYYAMENASLCVAFFMSRMKEAVIIFCDDSGKRKRAIHSE